MLMNYEEIHKYYSAGLLPVMLTKLSLTGDNIVDILFAHIETTQDALEDVEKELSEIEDHNNELEHSDNQIEALQDELDEYKDENQRMKDYIDKLEASVE